MRVHRLASRLLHERAAAPPSGPRHPTPPPLRWRHQAAEWDGGLPGFLEEPNGVHAAEDAALKASATSSPAKVAPLAEGDLEAYERPKGETRSLQALMEHRYDRKERRNARVEETLERLRRELPAAADARSGPGVLDFHRDNGDEAGYEDDAAVARGDD